MPQRRRRDSSLEKEGIDTERGRGADHYILRTEGLRMSHWMISNEWAMEYGESEYGLSQSLQQDAHHRMVKRSKCRRLNWAEEINRAKCHNALEKEEHWEDGIFSENLRLNQNIFIVKRLLSNTQNQSFRCLTSTRRSYLIWISNKYTICVNLNLISFASTRSNGADALGVLPLQLRSPPKSRSRRKTSCRTEPAAPPLLRFTFRVRCACSEHLWNFDIEVPCRDGDNVPKNSILFGNLQFFSVLLQELTLHMYTRTYVLDSIIHSSPNGST